LGLSLHWILVLLADGCGIYDNLVVIGEVLNYRCVRFSGPGVASDFPYYVPVGVVVGYHQL
jgi:hypothetical protein